MPSGVYPHKKLNERIPAVRTLIEANLAKGRTRASRLKAHRSLRRNGSRPEFREKMRKIALRLEPKIARKRFKAVQKFLRNHPPNFKGGNGQEPTEFIKDVAAVLEPQGFERELPINTKGHTTRHKTPGCYKVDFGDPFSKVAIEFDGPYHRRHTEEDARKSEVLESLGWTVLRIPHL